MNGLRWIIAAVFAFAAVSGAAHARHPDVFGSVSFVSHDLSALPQWTRTLEQMRERDLRGKSCEGVTAAAWCAQVAAAASLAPERKLRVINAFINAVVTQPEDFPPPGTRWPDLEAVLAGRGGALGAALAKYTSLRHAGFPVADLRVLVGEDVLRATPLVAVLGRIGNRTLVLMADTDAVHDAPRFRTFRPFYSFNEMTLWMHIPQGKETSP